jgi:hypothetical protein
MIASLKTLAKVSVPFVLAATFASEAFAATPAYVRVRKIAFAGSGCPAGTVAQNISPDRQAFTLLFDSYIAQVGAGVPFTEKRKNCQINVDLDFPNGWSYSLLTLDYRGYVALEPRVTGLQQSRYYFQGSSASATLKSTFRGPMDQNYQFRDTLGLSAVVWSPCGAQRALNINSELRLDNSQAPGRQGMLTNDSIDGALSLIYGFKWTNC